MFEKASRLKLRYESPRGLLSVEDLWELPLSSRTKFDLDTVAKTVNQQVKDSGEESFVKAATKANQELELKFDIVKHIIAVRLEEDKAKKDAKVIAEKKQQILELIDKKQTDALGEKSVEELRAELEALG